MRKDLLEFTDGLRIAKTRSWVTCAYSGDKIPQGDHGILVRSKKYSESDESVTDESFPVWISLDYRDELETTLDEFEFDSKKPPEDISPKGDIRYSISQGKTNACAICQTQMNYNEHGVLFSNRTGSYGNTSWVHVRCIPTLCAGLGDSEEYNTEVITAQLL